MKKFFLIFLVIFIISNLIYAEKGICLDDNVRVRSKPTLTDSSVVGKLNKNEIFEIYGYEGSGEYDDGFLDFWVSVSSDNNKWVNAYWISTLPLTFNETDYEGFEYNWKLTDYDKKRINLGQNSFAVFLQYDQYVFLSSFEINELK